MERRQLTALIEQEDGVFISFCPELDIASQGSTVQEARDNLNEAIELFFETASKEEMKTRLRKEVYVDPLELDNEMDMEM